MAASDDYAAFWVTVMGRPPLPDESGLYAFGRLAFLHGRDFPALPGSGDEIDAVRDSVAQETSRGTLAE